MPSNLQLGYTAVYDRDRRISPLGESCKTLLGGGSSLLYRGLRVNKVRNVVGGGGE